MTLPNLMTGTSFILALASILCSQLGLIGLAAWFIVWSVLLDLADGVVARLLNATSGFGAQFDSLADLSAFGIAPAFLVLHLLWQPGESGPFHWVMVPCAFFALAAAMRLARFNSESSTPPGWFSGVPTTLAGAIVATGVILLVNHPAALDESERYLVLTASVVVLGIAMISRLNFPKPRKSGRRSLNIVLSVNLVAIYVVGALRLWPEYLFVVALLYLAIGLIAGSRITIRS